MWTDAYIMYVYDREKEKKISITEQDIKYIIDKTKFFSSVGMVYFWLDMVVNKSRDIAISREIIWSSLEYRLLWNPRVGGDL